MGAPGSLRARPTLVAVAVITYQHLGHAGRLGNQLWQIASAVGIAATLGAQPLFRSDWVYRPWFSIPDDVFASPPIAGEEAWHHPLAGHLSERSRPYLQDLRLWRGTEPLIRDWFAPSALARIDPDLNAALDRLERLPSPRLCVHVRRGDNAQNPNDNHPLRPDSFYRDAIASYGDEVASLAIVSDDQEWCEKAFDPGGPLRVPVPMEFFCSGSRSKEHEPAYLTEEATDWRDLFLIAAADWHVVPNSTFGWWGAWLSRDPAPRYPTPWFGPALQPDHDASLMFPAKWVGVAS